MFDKRKDNDGGDAQAARAPQGGQAMGTNAPGAAPKANSAFISGTISIKGELSGTEDVVVAGEFEGNINLPSQSLTITQSGKVRADVHANVVEIQGELIGDIEGVDKVLITPTGRMQGNIKSPRVILDDGAQFKGSIDMEPAPQPAPRQPAPKPAAEAAPANAPAQAGQGGQGGQARQGGQGGKAPRQGASS